MGLMLDVTIGMSAIYLFVSLFVTTIQELIAQLLALRAKYLNVGITNLVKAGQETFGLIGTQLRPSVYNDPHVTAFYAHPMIAALSTNKGFNKAAPSYISKDTFTAVALDLTQITQAGTTAQQILQGAAALDVAGASPLEKAVAVLAREAGGDLDQLKAKLGAWFDDAMERVSGAYKRWAQVATLIIGFLVAVLANVDTVKVSQALINSPQQALSLPSRSARYSRLTPS